MTEDQKIKNIIEQHSFPSPHNPMLRRKVLNRLPPRKSRCFSVFEKVAIFLSLLIIMLAWVSLIRMPFDTTPSSIITYAILALLTILLALYAVIPVLTRQ